MAGEETRLVGSQLPLELPEAPPSIRVRVDGATVEVPVTTFQRAFAIGREPHCELQIDDERVSRQHVEIAPEGAGWWVRDLGSLNGTYVHGATVGSVPIGREIEIELGSGGPRVTLSVVDEKAEKAEKEAARAAARRQAERERERYVHAADKAATTPDGSDGVVLQHGAAEQQLRRMRRFARTSGVLLGLAVIVIVGLVFALRESRNDGIEFFYEMKELELEVAKLSEQVSTREEREALMLKQQQLESAAQRYAALVEKTEVFGQNLSEEDRLILKVARVFGEGMLDVPEDFATEVKRYIEEWRKSKRYANALARVDEGGHRRLIIDTLKAEGLPPHFFYLALQESNFKARAVGPKTRYGHAKGMWQFIPPTAKRYGLALGPLSDTNRYDPRDERFDVPKATAAAARYLARIYRTDAQASGLLVMASYNWGEGNVIKRIRKLPEDPRERNFWALLREHKIPEETYNYVFYIFSAAVIGENPELFGFDFAPPLA